MKAPSAKSSRRTGRSTGSGKPRKRPYVIVNMAMTADGKIATANRRISSFGSRKDHEHLLELRATADAVLCGSSTAAGKNITLGPGPVRYRNQRLRRGLSEINLRVIASGSGNMDPGADLFDHRFSPVLVLVSERAPLAKIKRLREVADEVVAFGRRELDLPAALEWLRREWKVKRLICEGGGTLNDAMFRAGLVDEVHLTICPLAFGGHSAPTIAEGWGFLKLADAAQLKLRSRRTIGNEQFLVYEVLSARASAQRAISHKRSARRLK